MTETDASLLKQSSGLGPMHERSKADPNNKHSVTAEMCA